MPTINNLSWLEDVKPVIGATARVEVSVEEAPNGKIVLVGKIASEDNAGFYEEQSKALNDESVREAMLSGKKLTKEMANKLAMLDYQIYANHVIVDWELVGDDGKKIPYSPDMCMKVLEKLTKTQWNKIVNSFADESRFKKSALSKKEVAEAGNASGSD